jgi:hypothetical protein
MEAIITGISNAPGTRMRSTRPCGTSSPSSSIVFSTSASVNCSLYFEATMQIRTFGPMIRGLGGKADDMSGVWRAMNEKSTDRL